MLTMKVVGDQLCPEGVHSHIGVENEMMEERTVNNIVGVQMMARDNIYKMCMFLNI